MVTEVKVIDSLTPLYQNLVQKLDLNDDLPATQIQSLVPGFLLPLSLQSPNEERVLFKVSQGSGWWLNRHHRYLVVVHGQAETDEHAQVGEMLALGAVSLGLYGKYRGLPVTEMSGFLNQPFDWCQSGQILLNAKSGRLDLRSVEHLPEYPMISKHRGGYLTENVIDELATFVLDSTRSAYRKSDGNF